MLQSLMSCFACGDKQSSNVVAPENIKPSQIKVTKLNQSDIKTDDNKSRISMTTVTFLTSETAPSKEQNGDQQIRRRIQLFRKKDLPQRKAMESEFVRQNLVRSNVIYLIDKSWSEQYTQFLKNQKKTTMPPINNQKLLDSQNQLKTTAKERQDYFIVTQKIWKLVHGLYGGGPTIDKDYCFPVMPLSMKKLMIPPAGIENPKNLCFMIAVLQMLISIQQLNGYMLKKQYMQNTVNDSKKKTSHHIYQRMLKQYAQTPTDPKIIEIKQFATFFEQRFNPNEQHDAHEFFLSFAQHIQQQMKLEISSLAKTPNNPQPIYNNYFLQHKSMIDKIFAGQQQTIVNCVSCQYKSKTYLPFLEVVLSIVALSTIEQCLDNYFQSQKLKDLYQCENCKKKTKAIKSTCITKTPNYLLLVLGKFSCTTQKKIQHKIDYGHQLSIKKHCFGHCGDTNYFLQSIIIHKGTKSTKGHYYTLTRRGNKWFYFNDSSFQQIEQKDILGRDPYMLVYERVKST